ncbi:MAG TPA: VOC family protein [Usitatibacter sp.]|nr:VOC family protein [Usitatibacter sp.]
MGARLRHIAIVSDQYALLGRFYQAVFGMTTASDTRPERAVTVSDGYVGLNINPRKPGRPAGLDHFGLEVDDADAVCARLERHAGAHFVKRPGTRPFAGISANDPAGNVFDISQAGMENRKSVYVEAPREQPRAITHLAIRTLHAERLADFYAEVFGLERLGRAEGDTSFHLSDGRVRLILVPWDIRAYEGGGIVRPAPDHIGFRVESLDAFKEKLESVGDNNPHLRPLPLGRGSEGAARLRLLAQCRCGSYQLADPDGILIDVAEG